MGGSCGTLIIFHSSPPDNSDGRRFFSFDYFHGANNMSLSNFLKIALKNDLEFRKYDNTGKEVQFGFLRS